MKLFSNKQFQQKITIVLVIIILFNFLVPIPSRAEDELGGDLLKELIKLIVALGDIITGAMNHFMLGTTKMYSSAIMRYDDAELRANLENPESSLYYGTPGEGAVKKTFSSDYLFEGAGWFWDTVQVPNILYCPENIFANKIAMLDVNFINPNKYSSVEYMPTENSTDIDSSNPTSDSNASTSLVERTDGEGNKTLRQIIASWYKAFRNIAIVGLLIVLVYIGIRIMISSTSSDKAKYKENLQDWLVAFCLVFFIHYIMAGILMLSESFTDMINSSFDSSIYIDASAASENDIGPDDSLTNLKFRTTITGYIRFMVQSDETGDAAAYGIMFLAMIMYTVTFTIAYIKRFLYVAFFTMIAPLVALSYPIDKIRDGKGQAFSLWFKEYTMNVIIQPVHLLLFTVFIGSVMNLAANNPIYAIVSMGFLLPAEKVIKKMFGLEATSTAKGLGELAGNALALKGASDLVGKLLGPDKDKNENKGDSNKIRQNRGPDSQTDLGSLRDALPGSNERTDEQNQQTNNNIRIGNFGQTIGLGNEYEEGMIQGDELVAATQRDGHSNSVDTQEYNSNQELVQQGNQNNNNSAIQVTESTLNQQQGANFARDGVDFNGNWAMFDDPDGDGIDVQPNVSIDGESGMQSNNQTTNFSNLLGVSEYEGPTNYDGGVAFTNDGESSTQSNNQTTNFSDLLGVSEYEGPTNYDGGITFTNTWRRAVANNSHRGQVSHQTSTNVGTARQTNQRVDNTSGQVINNNNRLTKEANESRLGVWTGIKAVGRKKIRGITEPFREGNRMKTVGNAAKFVVKKDAQIKGALLGGAAGLMLGTAKAITNGGDFSQGFSVASAAAMQGANFAAGKSGGVASGVTRTISEDIKTYRENSRSSSEYKREELEKIDKSWRNNTENYEYLRKQGLNDREAKIFLNSPKVDYIRRNSGIDDIKTLYKTLKRAERQNYSDRYTAHLAKMANTYKAGFGENEQNSLYKNLTETKGLTREQANQILDDLDAIYT